MLKQFIGASIIIAISACGRGPQPSGNPSNGTDSTANDPFLNLNVQTSNFSVIDTSGILLFPLSMGETERDGGSFYKDRPSGNWNIIFLNTRTNAYHLLSDKKMLIVDYNIKNYSSNYSAPGIIEQQSKNHLFYNIITEDFNHDKQLTTKDPTYLFATDREGHNLRQLSPSGYHVQNWQYIGPSNKIIMNLKRDTDNDKAFNDEDGLSTFIFDMTKDTVAHEVFSQDFKAQLKTLYNRDWKRIK